MRRVSTEMMMLVGVVAAVAGSLLLQASLTEESESRRVGTTTIYGAGRCEITNVVADGPAARAGILPGDVLVAVNGQRVEDGRGYNRIAATFARGRPARFEVLRGKQSLFVEVSPGFRYPWSDLLFNAINSAAYLAVAILALRRRPGHLAARLVFVFAAAAALEMASPQDFIGMPTASVIEDIVFYVLTGIELSTELHIVSIFPERTGWVQKRPRLLIAFYLLGIGVAIAGVASTLSEPGRTIVPWSREQMRSALSGYLLPLWSLAIPGLLAYPALRFQNPTGRLQARLLLLGSLPWTIFNLATASLAVFDVELPDWLLGLQGPALLCFPLAALWVLHGDAAIQEQVMLELTREVQKVSSVRQVADLVAKDLQIAFHPRAVYVFYRNPRSQDFALGHFSGVTRPDDLPAHCEFLRIAEREGMPLDSLEDLGIAVPREERDWLEKLGARLIVPISGQDNRLVGLLLLGSKSAGEPYTVHDRRLLRSLAGQIGLVYENALLKEEVHYEKRMQREVLDRLHASDLNLVKECPRCGSCFDSVVTACTKDGTELRLSVAVERVVNQRYRLDKLVGKGGMGAVYEALDVQLGRRVAAKVLLASLFGDHDALHRFKREARVSGRLSHPNIATVFDYGETSTGGAFLIMELLDGFTIRSAIQRQGQIAGRVLASWLPELCAGLSYAHAEHVVHRDLKPANVFLARGSGGATTIKILDFGLAKMRALGPDDLTSLTVPGMLLGTLGYMAPEQLHGADVDERADIFALGVLVAEALTGRLPFLGDTPAAIIHAVCHDTFGLLGNSEEIRSMNEVLGRCLAKVPWERYPSVAEAARDLLAALHRLPGFVAPADNGASMNVQTLTKPV